MYALIDGNSFYASCERVYRPDLKHSPIIVLSNNDGCVITRTEQAKALGITMGAPIHTLRTLIKRHHIQVFSSNYELYGDLSRRMMNSIATLVPTIEIYSIDECFADLNGLPPDTLTPLGHQIRQRVLQWVGIPTCVGIAPTKTLAKYCNHLAKRHPTFKGIVNWNDWSPTIQKRALDSQPASAVWGIGQRISEQLKQLGIHSAGDLARAPHTQIRKHFGVTIERTQKELNGTPCLQLEHTPSDKKQLIRSRSFGHPITELTDIQAALAHHASEAARDLRHQHSTAHHIGILLHTNPFNPQQPQYHINESTHVPSGTADTRAINQIAQNLLERTYKSGYIYKKCGILLSAIESTHTPQQLDWINPPDDTRSQKLMQCIDHITQRHGKNSLKLGTEHQSNRWAMRREQLSPSYTVRFDQLLRVQT